MPCGPPAYPRAPKEKLTSCPAIGTICETETLIGTVLCQVFQLNVVSVFNDAEKTASKVVGEKRLQKSVRDVGTTGFVIEVSLIPKRPYVVG